jgi:hypothetical protein
MSLNTGTRSDLEAVRNLVAYWLRRDNGTEPGGYPDSPDCASEGCVDDALEAAEEAGVPVHYAFGSGVEFGIAAALAVLDDPFSRGDSILARIKAASGKVTAELDAATATTRRDAEIDARAQAA